VLVEQALGACYTALSVTQPSPLDKTRARAGGLLGRIANTMGDFMAA